MTEAVDDAVRVRPATQEDPAVLAGPVAQYRAFELLDRMSGDAGDRDPAGT